MKRRVCQGVNIGVMPFPGLTDVALTGEDEDEEPWYLRPDPADGTYWHIHCLIEQGLEPTRGNREGWPARHPRRDILRDCAVRQRKSRNSSPVS